MCTRRPPGKLCPRTNVQRSDAIKQPPRRIPRQLLLALIQGAFLVREVFASRRPPSRAPRMPSGSTNQINAIHSARMISVPPIIITLLPGRLPATRVAHAPSRGAQRQSERFQCDFEEEETEPRPAKSRPGYLPGCRRPVRRRDRRVFNALQIMNYNLGPRPGKSSGAVCRRLKHDGNRRLSVAVT
jgi:hypothetical protein